MASIELQETETGERLQIAEQVIDKINEVYATDDFLHKLEDQSLPVECNVQRIEDDYVLLEKQDAIEAIAYYIASFVQHSPEAQNLQPKQLQAALQSTFVALKRRRLQQIMSLPRHAYRCAAVSYTAYRLYEHPWLARAALTAAWTAMKMAYGVVLPV